MWQLLRRLLLVNDDQADDAKAQVAVTVAGSQKRPVICVQIARDAIESGRATPCRRSRSSLSLPARLLVPTGAAAFNRCPRKQHERDE
jgi:hypothetical protein